MIKFMPVHKTTFQGRLYVIQEFRFTSLLSRKDVTAFLINCHNPLFNNDNDISFKCVYSGHNGEIYSADKCIPFEIKLYCKRIVKNNMLS